MTTYRQEIKISECYVVNNSLNHQKQFLFTAVTLLIVSKGCKAVSVILVIISNAIITMVLQVSVGYDVMDPVCSLKRDRPVPQIFALCVKNIQKKRSTNLVKQERKHCKRHPKQGENFEILRTDVLLTVLNIRGVFRGGRTGVPLNSANISMKV